MKRYEQSDLEEIARNSDPFLSSYSGKKIFIAGATGFVGSWLVSFFDFTNRNLGTGFEVTALARTINQDFETNFSGVRFLQGDLANLDFGRGFNPNLIINAATPSVPKRGGEDVFQILKGSIEGTENLIRACSGDKKPVFLNLSSGIVSKRAEDFSLDLSVPKDAYLHGKRVSEAVVSKAIADGKIFGKNLRLYAFAGPGISLSDHFAVGNFLADAGAGRPINIKGNPATVRSYLYPTDLIINLLNQSLDHSHENIDLGSLARITMLDLALTINWVTGNSGINVPTAIGAVDDYAPEMTIKHVIQNVHIEESICRWFNWLQS
jgi:dTDP-glucose 4,6-dehydratase